MRNSGAKTDAGIWGREEPSVTTAAHRLKRHLSRVEMIAYFPTHEGISFILNPMYNTPEYKWTRRKLHPGRRLDKYHN